MELPRERVGPYVRALQAGLDALAPHDDHVPLAACIAHLQALDPVLSGDLLLPAEVSVRTGMPAFAWMERALSEQTLARMRSDDEDLSERRLRRVAQLDAGLGERLRDRRELHRHLRAHALLPKTSLAAAVRRLGSSTDFSARYDRMAPDGRWLRIRFDLSVPAPRRRAGPLWVSKGRARVDDSLQHLMTRHFATPLMALRSQLAAVCEAEVHRLSRSWVGPFWFPDIALPDDVPAALGQGLLLHTATEVVARDVHEARHLDPWHAPPDEVVPEGQGVFRERRLAAHPSLIGVVQAWVEASGIRSVVVPIGAQRMRRL